MAIPVKLNVFEGPLDLLLHLIDKNKIEAKIDSLPNNQQNQNEILESKSLVNDIDNQIKDKFNQLKALDAQLKQFEKTHY